MLACHEKHVASLKRRAREITIRRYKTVSYFERLLPGLCSQARGRFGRLHNLYRYLGPTPDRGTKGSKEGSE